MLVTIEDWVRRVRTNMEELTVKDDNADITEFGVDINNYILEKLPDAISRVFIMSPSHLLEGVECSESLVPEKRQDGSGSVVFPENVLRLLLFKMKGWRRPVTAFIDSRHPKNELQDNPYARGGTCKPVAALTASGNGMIVLNYYSLSPYQRQHEVESAIYVPVPEMVDGGYRVPRRLVDAVGYLCAAMVYEILAQPDMAAQMTGRIVLPE